MPEYKVKLPIFEGPLDLLLHLIRQNEMEISEISISQITSQYLDMIRLMEALDLELAGDFLVMAATLLNIKLRALLPASAEEEEEGQEEELDNYMSARQLMQKLIEYRKFKEAAYDLGGRAERQAQIFVREVALPALAEAEKDDTIRGDLNTLLAAFGRVLKFAERRFEHRVKEEEFTVDEKITLLRRELLVAPRLALSEVFSGCGQKIEMIVTLIAVLELCRMKEMRVRQNDHFGEVFLFRTDAAPEEEFETTTGSRKLNAAAVLERIEAEIIASRTGVLDDGVPAEDTEDQLLEMLYQESQAETQDEEAPTEPSTEMADATGPPAEPEALGRDELPVHLEAADEAEQNEFADTPEAEHLATSAVVIAAGDERVGVLQTPPFDAVADPPEPPVESPAEIVELVPDWSANPTGSEPAPPEPEDA